MSDARWQQIRELFDRALDLPAGERADFVASACDDSAIRAEVLSLLAAAEASGPLDSLASRITPLSELFNESVPDQVGPYIVGDRIGQGGMAVVHRARDPRLARDVALKFLPATLRGHDPAAERLIAEARAASALDHPNICTIFDIAAAANDRLFIAMAYYPGGTLQDRLMNGPLPVHEALDIAGQVAAALQRAHEAGIVHRDVKPANIAFGERGIVKVLDFGVAVLGHEGGSRADGDTSASDDTGAAPEEAADDDASASDDADKAPEEAADDDASTSRKHDADAAAANANATARASAGTPSYMSPEQVRGGAADPRSDVWSLGVVLFEMLTGTRPFTGPNRAAIHREILHTHPPLVTSLRPEVPQRVAAMVDRALGKNPAHRFASAADFAAAIAAARAPGSTRSARMRRYGMIAAAAVVLLTVISAIARQRSVALDADDSAVAEQLARAHERYVRGTPESTEAAIAIVQHVMAQDSTNARARALLASAYAVSTGTDFTRAGQPQWLDSATAHANAAIRLAPTAPDGHSALGVVLRRSGRLEEAAEQQQRALRLDPEYALAMIELGFVTHMMSRYDEAVIWLERGLALEPEVFAARQYAAALYRVFEMPDEARRHIDTGLRTAPDNASLIWESVLLSDHFGDAERARKDFTTYLQLVSVAEHDRMNAWYQILLGNLDSARVHMDRLNLDAAPWYDLRQFGVTYMLTGEPAKGRELLERALEDFRANAGAPEWGRVNPGFNEAYTLAALGRREESIEALRAWDARGGITSWPRTDRPTSFTQLIDGPEFDAIVRSTQARFYEKRARIAQELARLRD